MSNLVERWKKQLACYRAGFRSSINEQIIIETIEALKPVEDADVRAHIINIAGAYPKAADALERLARENAEYEEGNDADAEVIQLLQAKIEELQEKIDDLINARNLAWDKGYSQGRDDAHQTITGLQAKVYEQEKEIERLKGNQNEDT